MGQICFESHLFTMYVIVLALLFGGIFVFFHMNNTRPQRECPTPSVVVCPPQVARECPVCIQDKSELNQCRTQLASQTRNSSTAPGRDYNSDSYQQVGILYNQSTRIPLYGKKKYPGRSDKWEYYAVDDSRNSLRLEVKSQNFNEFSTGDTVTIPALGADALAVEMYEYNKIVYLM